MATRATIPINIPGRPSLSVTPPAETPPMSPLRHSGSSPSGHSGSTLPAREAFYAKAAGKGAAYFQRNLLSSSQKDEKVHPSDYFYAITPVLANLSTKKEHTLSLRPKVTTLQNLKEDEKKFVQNKCEKKETIPLEKCLTNRGQYIKYKVDKQIILDDITKTYSEHNRAYIKGEIIHLVASLRLRKSLLNKPLLGIDDSSLSAFLHSIPDFTERYYLYDSNGKVDKAKLQALLSSLKQNDQRKFDAVLNSICEAKKPNEKTDKSDARTALAQWVKELTETPAGTVSPLPPNCEKVFAKFVSTKSIWEKLNREAFSLLTEPKKEEAFNEAKKNLAEEIKESETKLESIFTTYFSKFPGQDVAKLRECIKNDIEFNGEAYEFYIQSIDELGDAAKTSLNCLAKQKKQHVDDDTKKDLCFSLFEDDSSTLSGGVEINATDKFKTACQEQLELIAEVWNHNRSTSVIFLHSGVQSAQNKLADGLIKLLNLDTQSDYGEVVSIIIDDLHKVILINKTSFFFNTVEQYFINFGDKIKADCEHPKLTTDLSLRMIHVLVNEQKRHVFERFTNLNNVHEGFVRDANYIIDKAEALEKGAGNKVRDIILHMLENSENTDEKTTSVFDNHHDHHIMGNRKINEPKFYDNDETAAKNLFGVLLLPEKHKYRKDNPFDHAHTFPFPAVMNWRLDKLKELIGGQGYSVDALPQLHMSPLLKEGFDKFKTEVMTQKSTSFQQQTDTFSRSFKNDPAKFMYVSLNLLSTSYLSLLSETEYLPAFLNKVVDRISEWGDYKTHIRESLVAMVKTTSSIAARGKLSDNFKDYIPKSLEVATDKEESWSKKATAGIHNAIIYKVLQVFALQAKQAAINAM